MPATLVALHSTSAVSVALEHLNVKERGLALYASDMPRRYYFRPADRDQVRAWIAQGVTRLGLEELHYMAAVQREHRLAWLDGTTKTEAYAEPFSDTPRLDRAEKVAASTLLVDRGVSEAAKARQYLSASELCPVRRAVAA